MALLGKHYRFFFEFQFSCYSNHPSSTVRCDVRALLLFSRSAQPRNSSAGEAFSTAGRMSFKKNDRILRSVTTAFNYACTLAKVFVLLAWVCNLALITENVRIVPETRQDI